MVNIKNISTKTGDQGKTSLANGQRLAKDELVFEVIGTLDELNSWLGLVLSQLDQQFDAEKQFLIFLQQQLFVMGAELAGAKKVQLASQVLNKIEQHSSSLQKQMADDWHNKFVLPGGSQSAAQLDIARTVCRRAERRLVSYHLQYQARPLLLKTLNRLSDYLYVLRCWVNFKQGVKEILFD
ncbi:MAG: cob(I)yrinic acid a,c-diamide adenosyltransferase [Candidatus Pacebacteria bacterium]|nr:cob(I)yrinic acid a,c-diamide adenosyltransferase [Candidatus Paceibacterota bacterium]